MANNLIQRRERQTVSPWAVLSQLQEELDRWLDIPQSWYLDWGLPPVGLFDRASWPPLDVIDTGDSYVVRAELPGQEKDKVSVSVEGNVLTIEGEIPSRTDEVAGEVLRSECLSGKFHRTVGLPAEIQADNVKATYKAGVLEITLPKAEEHRPRQIEVAVQ